MCACGGMRYVRCPVGVFFALASERESRHSKDSRSMPRTTTVLITTIHVLSAPLLGLLVREGMLYWHIGVVSCAVRAKRTTDDLRLLPLQVFSVVER